MDGREELIPEENCRAAAYYGVRCIQEYVNDIRAAAHPRTPEEFGGEVYVMFNKHLQLLQDLLHGYTTEEAIARAEERRK